MLVLSRKMGERIQIGPDVVITVVRISAGVVRIGVEAPQSLAVVREKFPGETEPAGSPATEIKISDSEPVL